MNSLVPLEVSSISSRNVGAFYKLMRKLSLSHEEARPIAVIGAGVSAQAGLDSWTSLLSHIHSELERSASASQGLDTTPVSALKWKFLQSLNHKGDYPWRAEEYRRLAGKKYLHEIILRRFSLVGTPAPAHVLLAQLNFSDFVTTNFDHLLEKAIDEQDYAYAVVDWGKEQEVQHFFRRLDQIRGGQKHLVYLHGRLGNHKSIILTEKDYVERYVKSDDTNRKLFSLFMHRPLVFVGYSLSDPEITNLLRIANAHRGEAGSNHIALMALKEEEDETVKARTLNGKYGIQPVFYRSDTEHSQLVPVLQAMLTAQTLSVSEIEIDITNYIKNLQPSTDPQNDKNYLKYGHNPSDKLFSLEAEIEETPYLGWYKISVRLRASRTVTGTVKFILDETFSDAERIVQLKNGIAAFSEYAYGAFTVGAEVSVDEKTTKLGLDLSQLNTAPLEFRLH